MERVFIQTIVLQNTSLINEEADGTSIWVLALISLAILVLILPFTVYIMRRFCKSCFKRIVESKCDPTNTEEVMRAETHPVKIGILISNRCYGETRKQRGALRSPFESLPEVERDHYNGKLLLQSLGFEEIIELFDASHDQLTETFN